MQLDFQERQILKRAVAQARYFEQQQLAAQAEQLRAEIAQERATMIAELATLKANIIGDYEAMREELAVLREYHNALCAHLEAKQELAAIYRRHTIERAMEAVRDPTQPLQ
jgi:hypothetical protein